MIGHPVELSTFWVFTVLASHLEAGSVTALNFARNFQSVPVSLIGITLATTTFPLLAQAAAGQNFTAFRQVMKHSLWLIAGGSLLAAAFTFVVREPLISLVFGGGAFDLEDIKRTALVLGVFTFAIPTESLAHLLARGFYATKNTFLPVLTNIAAFLVAAAAATFLMPRLGIIALPLGFFFGSFLRLVLLSILLPQHLGRLQTRLDGNHPS